MPDRVSNWRPTREYLAAKIAARQNRVTPGETPRLEIPASDIERENSRLAQIATSAPRIPWDEFYTELDWRQGEHFALIGPTGQGKTTMMKAVLPKHPYVVVFATKPVDSSMSTLERRGYQKIERWLPMDPDLYPRRILWPNAQRMDSRKHQREIFKEAMDKIFKEGGWTVAIDELWYIINMLKMEPEVTQYLMQARSLYLSILLATQRPAKVPLEVYDQSTHLMFWRDNDERNLSRISGISYRAAGIIRGIVADLEQYQVLYVNTRTGRMVRTRCPAIV
jgi:hypothetical protein